MSKIRVVAIPSHEVQIREKLKAVFTDVRYNPNTKEFRCVNERGAILYRLKFVQQFHDGGLAEKFNAWALRYNKVVYIGAGAEKCISRLGVAARATFVPFEDFVKG